MELSIAQHVFSNYFDDAQVINYSVINNGLINKTYKLDTSQGIYILHVINQHVFKEPKLALENIKGCLHGLRSTNLTTPFQHLYIIRISSSLINCGDYYHILMLHPIMRLRTKKWFLMLRFV